MTLEQFNSLTNEEAATELVKCCGASLWVDKMLKARSFKSKEALFETGKIIWDKCSTDDGLEAFKHHPKIGDLKSLKKKYAATKDWADNEQAGVKSANHKILQELAKGNRAYEMKFGYIFIVCATGKSAKEMLDLLKSRLHNHPSEEIKIAMGEQHKITEIRINKLIE